MSRQKLSQQVMWVILITLLLAGCYAPVAEPTPIPPTLTPNPTPTSEPSPESVPEGIVVTFDGNVCTVSGPTELPAGDQPFVLNDLSEMNVDLWVSRLNDGKTLQDLLDEQSEPGVWWPKPSWVEYSRHTGGPWKNANGVGEIWTYFVEKEGDYFVYVGKDTAQTKSLWVCAPLKVIEAPSE